MLSEPSNIGGACDGASASGMDREARIRAMVDVMSAMDDMALEAAEDILPMLADCAGQFSRAAIGGAEIEPHQDHYRAELVSRTLNGLLEKIGNAHGIFDLAQDNGLRVLTVKLLLNLGICPGRGGNDLFDENGTEYELKTLNLDNVAPGVTTSHHLKGATIERYRRVGFIIAAYRHGRLVSIYILHPEALEGHFLSWEAALVRGKSHLNNPLIPISTVRTSGELVYGEPLARRKPKKSKRQLEMYDPDAGRDPAATQAFSSLEASMAASLEKSRNNKRFKLEKAEEKARKIAAKETDLQCHLAL